MTTVSYFLAPHVHVCLAGRQVVLLDLERDKYLAIAQTHPLARWVRGWPAPLADLSGATAENGLLAQMLARGLLVTDPAIGKEAAPVAVDRPRTALVEFDLDAPPRASFAHLRSLLAAYAGARWSLKHWPMRKVVELTRQRKQRAPVSASFDVAAARALVSAFMHLRPLFYGVHGACLLDSLTLLRYLARYQWHPEWVFAVKTDPFYPHCWVQWQGFVLNDTPERLKGFTPILVV